MDEKKRNDQMHKLNEFDMYLHRMETDLERLMALSKADKFNDAKEFERALIHYECLRENGDDKDQYRLWKSITTVLILVKGLQTESDLRMLNIIKDSMKEVEE